MAWYPMNRKADYCEVVVAWVQQLLASPTSFPTIGVERLELVQELLPTLDAWIMRPGALELFTDGAGSWIGIRPGGADVPLVAGIAAREVVMERAPQARVWHGHDAYLATHSPMPTPWRLFTLAPERYLSGDARRRMARALMACQDQGLC